MEIVKLAQAEPGIWLLTMDRGASLNALSRQLLAHMHSALDQLRAMRECHTVIITGAGKGFCAGADLTEQAGPGDIPVTEDMGELGFVYKYQQYLADLMRKIRELPQPVIAAVNGAALGGGLAIALASDIRVASERARFGAVFIKAGLSSCDVGTRYLLPRIVGAARAAELMLTGRIFDADEAQAMGLVHSVTPVADLIDSALVSALQICANNEYGVWMTKMGLCANLDASSLLQAMALENRTQVLGYFSGNMEEAMKAFVEGRAPQWKRL